MSQSVRAVPQAKPWTLNRRSRERIISFLSPIALLLLWEVLARLGILDTRFFPAPSQILSTLLTMMKSGELQDDTLISMTRLAVGFLVGGIPGLIIGVVMGLNSTLRAMIDPLIAATYPIPKSSILPLALLVLGLGEASKIFMVAIGVFYPIAMNSMAGVREINRVYLDVGHNFKASRLDVFRTIALPGAMPMIMTGVKLGVGMGLVLIAIAEMVGAKSGLGYLIWNAWETFAVDQMYVGLFVIALIGFALTLILNELEKILVPWKS
ncbi:MAG: ABC transporter permease [Xanthobacteraceae bacterium]|jgi:ABC-type nitrate/sulfonate/bicarbonate transport system permease component